MSKITKNVQKVERKYTNSDQVHCTMNVKTSVIGTGRKTFPMLARYQPSRASLAERIWDRIALR